MELLAIGLGTLVALGGWWYLFRRPNEGVWNRSWVVAGVLSLYSIGAIVVLGRLGTLVGPIDAVTIGSGLLIGGAWLVATHIGHRVLCRMVPGFIDQVTDLYSLRAGDRVSTIVGPVVAMGLAEELFFRGVVQGSRGLAVAVIIYGAVQIVAGKWALVLAALLGGTVWGLLYWWTGGLVAPALAHVLWTGALTFVWPLRGCGDEAGAADAAPLANERKRTKTTDLRATNR